MKQKEDKKPGSPAGHKGRLLCEAPAEHVVNFGRAANIQRIAEILSRHANDTVVVRLLEMFIEKYHPEARLAVVNESES